MKRLLVIPILWMAFLFCGPISANHGNALHHASVREVLVMVRGGVATDVMVERVRRMEDVHTLDATAVGSLIRKGVPDEVLLELARRRKTAVPCEIPERRTGVNEVLGHPSIREVVHQVHAGVATDAILERIESLPSVPVLDARPLARLTSQGVPDKVLLELIRRQEVPTGCDAVRAELLAAARDAEQSALVVETKREKRDERERKKEALKREAAEQEELERAERRRLAAEQEELEREESKREDAARQTEKAELRRNAAEKKERKREEKERQEVARALSSEPPAPESATNSRMGRIRVVAKSSLPVTYLEVHLDGAPVTRRGEVQEGETKPGWMLPPPPVLEVKRGAVVFESELPVGPHEVKAAFALARIVDTDWDAAAEARGQRYDTTTAGPVGENGEVPVCEVREGRVCVVVARLLKRGDGYAVAYDSKLR